MCYFQYALILTQTVILDFLVHEAELDCTKVSTVQKVKTETIFRPKSLCSLQILFYLSI